MEQQEAGQGATLTNIFSLLCFVREDGSVKRFDALYFRFHRFFRIRGFRGVAALKALIYKGHSHVCEIGFNSLKVVDCGCLREVEGTNL